MSILRPECGQPTIATGMADAEAIFIRKLHASLKKRRVLIKGHLNYGNRHCAMGCFWADNDDKPVKTRFVEEVAAVNDAVPDELGTKVRMQIVRNWVENRAKALGVEL